MVLKNLLFKIPGSWCLSRHFFTTYKTWLTFQVAWIYAMIFSKKCYEQPHHHEPGNHQESFWQLILHAYEPLYLQFNHLFSGGHPQTTMKGWMVNFLYLWVMIMEMVTTKDWFFISDLAKLFNLKVAIFQWYHFSVCFFLAKRFSQIRL